MTTNVAVELKACYSDPPERQAALESHQRVRRRLEEVANAREAARRRADRAVLARELEVEHGPTGVVANAAWRLTALLNSLPAERIGQAVGLEHEASIAEAEHLARALVAYAELRAVRPVEIRGGGRDD